MVPTPQVASFELWCKKEKKGASDTIAGSAPHQSHLGRLTNQWNEDSVFSFYLLDKTLEVEYCYLSLEKY